MSGFSDLEELDTLSPYKRRDRRTIMSGFLGTMREADDTITKAANRGIIKLPVHRSNTQQKGNFTDKDCRRG